jgi:hypothetical protein
MPPAAQWFSAIWRPRKPSPQGQEKPDEIHCPAMNGMLASPYSTILTLFRTDQSSLYPCEFIMPKPPFAGLWSNYPASNTPCDGPWDNQCAIRLSITLNSEGTVTVSKSTYTEPRCAHDHARGAESLANWLWRKHLGRPTIYADGATAKAAIVDKKGIIFFKDCFTRAGSTDQTGDHIDLWNRGSTKTYNDPNNKSKQVWFWELI